MFAIGFFSFQVSVSQETGLSVLVDLENKLYRLFQYMSVSSVDKDKETINQDIVRLMDEALNNPLSFDYPFDSLKYVGKIRSSDQRLRIYTWNLPYENGTHRYYGFLQYTPGKNNPLILYRLTDKSEDIRDPLHAVLNENNWYGALYYDVVETRDEDNRYYTLLGFDFNNLFSSKKIIDVLYFDQKNRSFFGKQIFQQDSKLLMRVIFEFSARVSMSLTYNKDKKMIIYDHLSPSKPSLAGKYQFYGPDMSYDGLKFEDGIWKLYTDLDMRNPGY